MCIFSWVLRGSLSVVFYDSEGDAEDLVFPGSLITGSHSVTSYDTQGDVEDLFLPVSPWGRYCLFIVLQLIESMIDYLPFYVRPSQEFFHMHGNSSLLVKNCRI
jgi:hypothetical protein